MTSSMSLINTRVTTEGLKGEIGIVLGLERGGKVSRCEENERQLETLK